MTLDQGTEFYNSKAWEPLSEGDRAKFQLAQDRLWMPFGVFHDAVENTLRRGITVGEMGANRKGLLQEILRREPSPTLEEIMTSLTDPGNPGNEDNIS